MDNKDKATVSEGDIKKLIRDVKERRSLVGVDCRKGREPASSA